MPIEREFLPGSTAPEPFGGGARAPIDSGVRWLPAQDSRGCQELRCRLLSKREPDTRAKPGTAAAVTHQRAIWRLTQWHKNELHLNITYYSQLSRALQKKILSSTIYPKAIAASRFSEGTIRS